jgi:DNA-binding CsgD family transcriptional regulator
MEKATKQIFRIIEIKKKNPNRNFILFNEGDIVSAVADFSSSSFSYQYIHDFKNGEFNYLSKSFEGFFNINIGDVFSFENYLGEIHPDDVGRVKKFIVLLIHFFYSHIDRSEVFYYTINYQFRIKDKFDHYKLMLHQSIPISMDLEENMLSIFVSESIIDNAKINSNISFIDSRGIKSFLNIKNKNDLPNSTKLSEIITTRELEILKLLSEGYSSKEVAFELHISYNTVRTHRNQILKKTHFKTMPHLVSHCVKEGLIK